MLFSEDVCKGHPFENRRTSTFINVQLQLLNNQCISTYRSKRHLPEISHLQGLIEWCISLLGNVQQLGGEY